MKRIGIAPGMDGGRSSGAAGGHYLFVHRIQLVGATLRTTFIPCIAGKLAAGQEK